MYVPLSRHRRFLQAHRPAAERFEFFLTQQLPYELIPFERSIGPIQMPARTSRQRILQHVPKMRIRLFSEDVAALHTPATGIRMEHRELTLPVVAFFHLSRKHRILRRLHASNPQRLLPFERRGAAEGGTLHSPKYATSSTSSVKVTSLSVFINARIHRSNPSASRLWASRRFNASLTFVCKPVSYRRIRCFPPVIGTSSTFAVCPISVSHRECFFAQSASCSR